MWKRVFDMWFPLSELDIIFGLQNETSDELIDTLNYCVLLAKYYIYQTKKNESKVFFLKFIHILKNKIDVLKTIYVSKNRIEKFILKWSELYDNL